MMGCSQSPFAAAPSRPVTTEPFIGSESARRFPAVHPWKMPASEEGVFHRAIFSPISDAGADAGRRASGSSNARSSSSSSSRSRSSSGSRSRSSSNNHSTPISTPHTCDRPLEHSSARCARSTSRLLPAALRGRSTSRPCGLRWPTSAAAAASPRRARRRRAVRQSAAAHSARGRGGWPGARLGGACL